LKTLFVPPMNGTTLRKIEILINALEQTYTRSAEEVPRIALWEPQVVLSRAHHEAKDVVKSLDLAGKALGSLGFTTQGMDKSRTAFLIVKWGLASDFLTQILMQAKEAFVVLGLLEKASKAEEYARIAFKILVGEDSSFSKVYV